MQTVIVTGANGFVGSHLIKELSDNGIEVVGVGGKQGSKDKPHYIDKYIVIDLNVFSAVQKIDFRGIDGVIHLAGLAAVGPSFNKPMDYIDTNIGIEVNLFEAALIQKARLKFLVISSGALYNSASALPLTESSGVLPSSPYAVSKIGQEYMSRYYQSRGFECIIARPFNHIGPHQNPGFIVPDIAKQIIRVEHGLSNEVLVGNLDAKRDFTDVRDIVRAYRLLLEKGHSGEIYNVCSGKPVSGHKILSDLLKLSKAKPIIKQDPSGMRPSDTPVIYGSYKKIADDTSWRPEIGLNQTLVDVMADWRSR